MNENKALLCLLEIALFNFIIYVLFFRIQDNQEVFFELNPHPLLFLVIAISMRYGNYLGIVTAAISSLLYLNLFYFLHEDIWELFIYFKYYKYILLFFWSALIFGSFRDNHLTRVKVLESEILLLRKNYKELVKSYHLLQKTHQELKKQIINSEESILNLYEIASRLQTLDSEEIYTETIGILSKYLKANAISIYTVNEKSGYLRLKICTGDRDKERRSLAVKDSTGLCKVVFDRQIVKWSDVGEESFPLMAAPLIKDGKVLAVVNLREMDFDRLSEYAFQLFKLIIDWVNRALGQAMFVDDLRQGKYINGTKILRYEAFMKRLKAEERRKLEFSMDFCLLEYRTYLLDLNLINERLYKIIRSVDVMGYDFVSQRLFILLPATPREQLPMIETRILNAFGDTVVKISERDKVETEKQAEKVLIGAR